MKHLMNFEQYETNLQSEVMNEGFKEITEEVKNFFLKLIPNKQKIADKIQQIFGIDVKDYKSLDKEQTINKIQNVLESKYSQNFDNIAVVTEREMPLPEQELSEQEVEKKNRKVLIQVLKVVGGILGFFGGMGAIVTGFFGFIFGIVGLVSYDPIWDDKTAIYRAAAGIIWGIIVAIGTYLYFRDSGEEVGYRSGEPRGWHHQEY